MALILHIDSAVETASVCLAKDENVLTFEKNEKQKDHAAWIHVAIKEIFISVGLELNALDAVAVTSGPGSYTGLRIGMAAVKGICYALNKPLITLNTLEVMAQAAKEEDGKHLCPMIDARRMEVFTAVYSSDLICIKEPIAMVLNQNSFETELSENSICFFGNGSGKFKKIIQHKNAIFSEVIHDARSMVILSEIKYRSKEFADLAYAEPLYLKEFYTPSR